MQVGGARGHQGTGPSRKRVIERLKRKDRATIHRLEKASRSLEAKELMRITLLEVAAQGAARAQRRVSGRSKRADGPT